MDNKQGISRAVVAVNSDGSVAGYFDSMSAASRLHGLSHSSIVRSCRVGSLCVGLRWYYEEDFRAIYYSGELDKLRFERNPFRDKFNQRFAPGHKTNVRQNWTPERRAKAAERLRATLRKLKDKGWYETKSIARYKEVICLDDGQVFPSVKFCAEHYGLSASAISASIRRLGSCHGLRFRFKKMWDSL